MKKTITFLTFVSLILFACNNAEKNNSTAANSSAEPGLNKENPAPQPQTADTNTSTVKPASNIKSAIPSFRMKNAMNQDVDLASLQGKKIFVNLWATWCPPCRAEIPSIENLAKKTNRNKVEFVMLSLDDSFNKAVSYANATGMKLPVYYPAGTLPPLFVTEGIPVTYIFNENGEIIYQQMGGQNYDTDQFVNLLK